MDGLIDYGWGEDECCTCTYRYKSCKPFSVMIRSKLAGVMTSDQVPMTEVGRFDGKQSWLVAKPHQVIVPLSGKWKLIYLK